jgi:hypothetical protein
MFFPKAESLTAQVITLLDLKINVIFLYIYNHPDWEEVVSFNAREVQKTFRESLNKID